MSSDYVRVCVQELLPTVVARILRVAHVVLFNVIEILLT